jgi:hypothetical protein
MQIKCHWICPFNKDGYCKQPKDLHLELSAQGYFTCNKLSEVCSASYDSKGTK